MMTDTTQLSQLPLLLEVKQAAAIGGWSEKFVRDMLRKGSVKGCKVGGSWRVNRDAFLTQLGLGNV